MSETMAVSPFNRSGVEDSPIYRCLPRIADCTLRDGEQQAGVVFSREDKIALAQLLDGMGVHDLEVGTPAVSREDQAAVEEIAGLGLRAEISALARARRDDVDLVAACGAGGVRLSFPISKRQQEAKMGLSDEEYLRRALEISAYAKGKGLRVIFSPYDTTRADLPLLRRLLDLFRREQCVDRVRLVDTTGAATPEAVKFLVGVMLEAGGGIPIEVHCHDDLGLATANTVAGALAGAAWLSTTINGVGERSGNAPLEEVVMALKVLYGVDVGIRTEQLQAVSAEVERRSGIALQAHKAVVGRNSFAHESGMVVAGLLADPFTAECYMPELAGQTRSIVLGKKSGAASVEFKLQRLGIAADSEQVRAILAEVKTVAIGLKRALRDAEFEDVVRRVLNGAAAS